MKHLRFITAIPLNVERGSGCYVGIRTLVEGLRALDVNVEMVTPAVHLPVFTAERILFNELLRPSRFHGQTTVGFDLDGYRLAGRGKSAHVAAIKGVLGDAVRFESGFTRASLAVQAKLEQLHAQRADRVVTISRYCAERLEQLYGVRDARIVPELIDLTGWRKLFAENPAPPSSGRFTVLCVCRFYPRKRVDILLRAAQALSQRIPELEIRIVGGGPDERRLRQLSSQLRLERVVHWLGNLPQAQLAREYTRADVFCLPSVQEGFGIVFLEAMAAGKPIVAVRSAAVPEVVEHGVLVEPDNPEALAHGIFTLYADSELRKQLTEQASATVNKYGMVEVARLFLEQLP